jgi:hypothetical protein
MDEFFSIGLSQRQIAQRGRERFDWLIKQLRLPVQLYHAFCQARRMGR